MARCAVVARGRVDLREDNSPQRVDPDRRNSRKRRAQVGSSSCPLLSRVDFSSCRLVSRVAFSSCPSLRRVDFSSCNSGVESPFRVATRESSRFFELQLGSRVDFSSCNSGVESTSKKSTRLRNGATRPETARVDFSQWRVVPASQLSRPRVWQVAGCGADACHSCSLHSLCRLSAQP